MPDDRALHAALRLALHPPGGISTEDLKELTRDRGAEAWDIATAAAHLAVSPHTLRYYERIGLVSVDRDHRGHRRYDAAAVRRLVFLSRMRTSGMPISALQRYVALVDQGESTVPERSAMLREHREALRSRIGELQLALAATEYKLTDYARSAGTPAVPSSVPHRPQETADHD